MNLFKAYKIWEKKKANSDFPRIKISSSGSFYMKSEDLFNDKTEVKRYVDVINASLRRRKSFVDRDKIKV